MAAVTRINDGTSGTCDIGEPDCCPHSRSGTNSSGSSNVFVNGRAVHRKGDSGDCNCPHGGNFDSTSGSSTVFVNGKAITRTGDSTSCSSCGKSGNHTSGSSNVFAG